MPDPTIRRATAQDAALLAEVGARTFRDAFAQDNTPEDMALHLARVFTPQQMAAELADPQVTCFLVEHDGEAAGYAKLQAGTAPACVDGLAPVEVARIYVDQHVLGRGLGAALMRACLDAARHGGHDVVWLGVWERNARAQAFYRRWGFEDVGVKTFTVGTDVQHDRVMTRALHDAAPR